MALRILLCFVHGDELLKRLLIFQTEFNKEPPEIDYVTAAPEHTLCSLSFEHELLTSELDNQTNEENNVQNNSNQVVSCIYNYNKLKVVCRITFDTARHQ